MRFENKAEAYDLNQSCPNKREKDDRIDEFSNYSMLPLSVLEWIENNQSEVFKVCDTNGKVIFVSRSIESLLGYTKAEVIGRHWYEILSTEEKAYLFNHYVDELNKSQHFNIELTHKNGESMATECLICKVIDGATQQVYYVVTLRDLTERKEAEKLLVRSEKMSVAGQLAAGIAHEIRNPLTSIKGFLQLLQAGVNRKEEYYKIMIEEIEKMEKITSELLFISKPLTDSKQRESVNEMVEDTISLLQSQARLKNIELVMECPVSKFIYCDRSQIKQVLINLVKNAIEAMHEPGKIVMKVESNESMVALKISDEGPGIPEEIIHKLGEPFFTTKKNGTGLGIMISKQIIEEHHGILEIIQNEGKGSTFIMSFPNCQDNK